MVIVCHIKSRTPEILYYNVPCSQSTHSHTKHTCDTLQNDRDEVNFFSISQFNFHFIPTWISILIFDLRSVIYTIPYLYMPTTKKCYIMKCKPSPKNNNFHAERMDCRWFFVHIKCILSNKMAEILRG